ncbi:MAG: hypothetical protein GTO45_09540 [Candidatus Aminicenantes bacterium]|nr:hypothetical protein [Candidatus Aminicenantes bacterium]NIM79057.1 hypothetical protein [Candidatus Aminicenantes bacterium]NIN18336.1 hypothetical protein [Candidatus Aminicenantes bacterium]NIN42223.1 hypothetical protein [Candidatus Aminicenantes bacterium]NIN84989.1 hypothetical protein [Candidatus Aminicenantes bacterium]
MFSILQKFSEIIKNTRIILYEFEENQVRIKAEVELIDGSTLVIKDYKFSNNTRKYAYHWMDKKEKLKIRWDNAPHWESISTFPHHKHVESAENLLPSTETNLESVLDFLKRELTGSQKEKKRTKRTVK